MTITNRFLLATALCALAAPAVAAFADLPAGWFKAGSHPAEYEMGLDETVRHEGRQVERHRQVHGRQPAGVRHADADDAAGRVPRQACAAVGVREVRKAHVVGRPLVPRGRPESRTCPWRSTTCRIGPSRGTTDWTRYEIVLDVPAEAQRLAFGILLAGGGQVWMDDLKFEVVPTTVKTPRTSRRRLRRPRRSNLNFEK